MPDGEQSECVNELLGGLAGTQTGVLEPFSRALSAWRSTAEVWSDPELARRLKVIIAAITIQPQTDRSLDHSRDRLAIRRDQPEVG